MSQHTEISHCLALNPSKTKEKGVEFSRKKTDHSTVYINGDAADRASDFKFLGTCISLDLTRVTNTSPCEKSTAGFLLPEVFKESQPDPETAAVLLQLFCPKHHSSVVLQLCLS